MSAPEPYPLTADPRFSPLPHPAPECPNARLALYAMRRMGANGLGDAHAAHALFSAFGESFRRPLVLLRALMADLAAGANGTIAIAPCCCPRATAAETTLLAILATVETAPDRGLLLMGDLLATRRADGVLASAAAVAAAFADEGRPIGGG